MTVPSTPRQAGPFTGTGSLTNYPFAFKVFAKEDLAVTAEDTAGTVMELVLDSGFLVTLNVDQDNTPGGFVQYAVGGIAAALPAGYTLAITGEGLTFDQPADLPSGGNFNPEVIERALDRLEMQIQLLRDRAFRTLSFPATDIGMDAVLPGATDRALRVLGFDASGLPIMLSRTDDGGSALALDLLNATDPAKGAAMIGFNAGYAGEQGVSLFELLAQSVSVLQFCDGVGDETTQFAAAMATGKKVYIPADAVISIADEAAFSAAGQMVWGFGTLQQLSANKCILKGNNLSGVGAQGITLKPGPDHTGSNRSDAVTLIQCDRWVFKDVTVDWSGCTKAHHGLRVINSSRGKASGNFFLNAPSTDNVYFTAGGADIALEESCSYNAVIDNHCISGNVYAINVTTNTAGGTTRGNLILGNWAHNSTAYGIVLYRSTSAVTADFSDNVIAFNDVFNIKGSVLSEVGNPTDKWFGAGIYDVDSTGAVIYGNTARNTCQQTNAGTLPMAGIASSSVTSKVKNNVVDTSGRAGFYFSAGNASSLYPAPARALLELHGNRASNCANELFKIYNARRVLWSNNGGETSASGAAVSFDTNGDWKTRITVVGVDVENVQAGLSINNASIATVQAAQISATSSTGITAANTDRFDLGGGSAVSSITGNGVAINTGVLDGVVDDVLIESVTGVGIVMGSNIKLGDEISFGTTGGGRYTGAFGELRTLANAASVDVKNGKSFVTGGTTGITTLTGGEPEQVITIRSAHVVTLTNSANLQLKGGVNANLTGGNIITLKARSTTVWDEVSRNF